MADVLNRAETEANIFPRDGEAVVGLVDIRRQNGDAHRVALRNVFGDLRREVEDGS
ncbi:hypothetical protein SDC9_186435 [bioreactor metagenome]|uniref:Uncharacterized protein n=1 Tax=bioreactor metagenome TaxID=1076179 RepID=A0A645HJI7_9ZZZZ